MNRLDDDERAWPDEPEEFDPDSLGPRTPDLAATVEPPEVDAVAASANVDDEVFRAFWGAVVFLNVALLGLSIGALLIVFRDDWAVGGPAMLVGSVAALFTVRYYLTGKRHLAASAELDSTDDEPTADDP